MLKLLVMMVLIGGSTPAWTANATQATHVGTPSPTGIEDIEHIRVKCVTGIYEEVSYEDLQKNKICEGKTFVSFCQQRFSAAHSDEQRQQINHTVQALKDYVDSNDCQEAYKRLRQLTFIAMQDKGITDLSPFIGLNKLRHLDLSHNHISDLSALEQLKELIILSVNSNRITELKVLDMPRLRRLYISGNPLTSLVGLSGMFNLRRLILNNAGVENYAGIENLDGLQYAERLEHLELVGAKLQDASHVGAMRLLRNLNLSSNALADMPTLSSRYLHTLDLSVNNINDLEFIATNRSLRKIDFSMNGIKDLTVLKNLPYLVAVDFSDNSVFDLSPLTNSYDLEQVGFRNNKIKDLNALAHLHQLTMMGEEFIGNPVDEDKNADNCPMHSVSGDLRAYCES